MPFKLLAPEVRLDSKEWLTGLQYELLTTERQVWEWVGSLADGQAIGADFETDRLNRFTGPVPVGLSLSKGPRTGVYLPCAHLKNPELNLPDGLIRDVLIEIDRRRVETVWWNYVFDGSVVISRWRLELQHWQDAMIAYWVNDPNQREYGLKATTKRDLGIPVLEYDSVTTGRAFNELSPQEAVVYVCADADNCLQLWDRTIKDPWFIPQSRVYHQIERPFTLVLRDENVGGIPTDPELWRDVLKVLGETNEEDVPINGMLKVEYDKIMTFTDQPINLNSAPQVGQLMERLGVGIEERTATGAIATGAEILAQYTHPLCQGITRYRQLVSAKQNYAEKFLEGCDHFGTNLIRFPFKQHGAPTGRMACGGESGGDADRAYLAGYFPINGQGIPDPKKRKELPDLRRPFLAAMVDQPDRDDWVWVAMDFAQFQLRIAANMSDEPAWIDAFAAGEDIHMANAKIVYGDDTQDRGAGKTMGFAVLFQATDKTVAEHGKTTVENAARMTKTFKDRTPKLQNYIDYLKQTANQHGYVQTHFGRRRDLSEYFKSASNYKLIGQGERYAVNTPIQGTEADLFKMAAARVMKLCRERGWSKIWEPQNSLVRQIMWVHDELDFLIHKSVILEALPLIKRTMEIQVPNWKAPLVVDAGQGSNWSEAKA